MPPHLRISSGIQRKEIRANTRGVPNTRHQPSTLTAWQQGYLIGRMFRDKIREKYPLQSAGPLLADCRQRISSDMDGVVV